MANLEPVEHADRADRRVRDGNEPADPLDAARVGPRRDPVHDDPVQRVDDGDVRLRVGRHIGERHAGAQRERRRRRDEQKAPSVHRSDTSGERVGVRPGEELVDRIRERPARARKLGRHGAGPLEQRPVEAKVREVQVADPVLARAEQLAAAA